MTAALRLRRLSLAILLVGVAIAPIFFSPLPPADAQDPPASTTSTTDPAPTTTTTLPPTTTTTAPPPPTTTSTLFDPDDADAVSPTPPAGGDGPFGNLPGWSLPFLGAGAMLAVILLATGVVRLATGGVPALGRSFGNLTTKTSNAWGIVTGRRRRVSPSAFSETRPTIGARFGGMIYALTSPFRRLGRMMIRSAGSAKRHRQATTGGIWSRIVLRTRMMRARYKRTRSTVGRRKRYWWLRFRNMLPWRR